MFANGEGLRSYSRVFVELPSGIFGVHVMEAGRVPILMSVEALRSLGAKIDFTTDEMECKAFGAKALRVSLVLHDA